MSVLTSKLIVALIDQVTAPARGIAGAVRHLQAASKANGMEMNAMRGRMIDAAGAAWALSKAIRAPLETAIAFESAMADVAKVSGFDDAGLDAFGKQLRKLSTSEIPMAVTELAELAENAAASGIGDSDLLDFTRMTAKAALAWGVSGGQAGEDLAKIKEALRLTIDETMLYADAINSLADKTASTAPDLTQFARNVAAQGEFYGYSRQEALAFGSAMISAGAEVDVASTSFRNMGKALTIGTSATKRQQKAFKTLGLDASKVAVGMQKDAVGTTMEVISRIGQVPAEMRASVMSQIFGDEARGLAPLLGDLDLLKKTLGYVSDESAYAGSVNAEFARRAKTTEFGLQRLKNRINEIGLAIGNALLPPLNAVIEIIGPLIMAFADFAAAHPEVVQAVFAIVGGLVALRVATLATRWAFLFLKGGVIDAALGMTRGAGAFLGLINPLNLVQGAVTALRFALLASGIGLILAGIAAAGVWIYNNWEGLTAFFQGFGSAFMAAIEPLMPVLQPVIDAGRAMLDWVTGMLGPVEASSSEWRGWGETVGTVVGGALTSIVEMGQRVIDFYSRIYGPIFSAIGDMIGLGATMMQQIWDGIQSKFTEMLAWFAGWPKAILDAIGKIDIGAAIIANLPPWLAELLGAGGPGATSNPSAVINGKADPGLALPGVAAAKAAGGSVAGGKTYLVGEYGPELVTPGRSGWVHNAGDTAGMMGGRGGNSYAINMGGITIHGSSDPERTAEIVMRKISDKLADALGGIHADIEYAG